MNKFIKHGIAALLISTFFVLVYTFMGYSSGTVAIIGNVWLLGILIFATIDDKD